MTEITNKHIFVTMLILGVVTIGLILGQYSNTGSPYSYGNSLGATAYNADYSGSPSNFGNRYSYVPDITRNYYPYDTTTNTVSPQTTSTTTYTYSYPSETTSTQTSYYNNSNLDAYGCAPGANYSVTTGQSCYGYNNYNNNGYYNNNNYNYNSTGGYYSNGVYIDYRGCGTGIIYSVKTGQLCSTIY